MKSEFKINTVDLKPEDVIFERDGYCYTVLSVKVGKKVEVTIEGMDGLKNVSLKKGMIKVLR